MSDAAYFTEMEAKIPTGKVRTRFAPSPTGYMHIGICVPPCIPGSLPAVMAARLSSVSRIPTRGGWWRELPTSSTAP